MTTTISLAARDFIVVGADSLATVSREYLNFDKVQSSFFKPTGEPLTDAAGNPVLANIAQISQMTDWLPVNQLPNVTKVFALDPKPMAILFAGISRIGDVSVKNLVEQFIESAGFPAAQTVQAVVDLLRDFSMSIYDQQIPNKAERPMMEILISGYSESSRQPEIFRLMLYWDWSKQDFVADINPEVKPGNYNITFGGQYDVIQRVVSGVDVTSFTNLKARSQEVLEAYRAKVEADLAAAGHPLAVIPPDSNDPDLDIFAKNWGGVTRIFANVSDLSEHAGVEFVKFLINTMIKSQEYSSSIPTVGGDIHIAVITKNSGFSWISKPYSHRAGN